MACFACVEPQNMEVIDTSGVDVADFSPADATVIAVVAALQPNPAMDQGKTKTQEEPAGSAEAPIAEEVGLGKSDTNDANKGVVDDPNIDQGADVCLGTKPETVKETTIKQQEAPAGKPETSQEEQEEESKPIKPLPENPVFRFFRTPLGFAVSVCALSALSCTVSFVIIPVSNPLQVNNLWHCSFTCTCVFVPVSVLYITMLLQDMVYSKVNRRVGVNEFLTMWVVTAFGMSSVLVGLAAAWVNPAPMNGAIAATTGIVLCSLVIYFVFIPRLGRSIGIQPTTLLPKPGNPLWQLQISAIAVIVFFVLSVLQLMTMLAISAFLLWVDLWYVSLVVLPAIRLLYLQMHAMFARFMDSEGSILGQSMAMVTVGIAMAIAVGSAANWAFTILFFVMDVMQGVHAAACVADIRIMDIRVSDLLLSKVRTAKSILSGKSLRQTSIDVFRDQQLKKSLSKIQTTFIVAAEAGEVIVPMNYALCWFIVRMGPNNKSFSGSGTSDFGLEAPEDTGLFLANIAALFSCELVSMTLIKIILWKVARINLMDELRIACQMYGPILICQSVWIIVTSFCMTMIHCGLDFSFQWSYVSSKV
jgi:hypothetical protein